MTSPAEPPPVEKADWKLPLTWPVQVGLLFLLAVAHRTWIVARTTTIASDGGFYLQAARDLYAGDIQYAFVDSHFHPLHFILTATLADFVGGRLDWAAYVLAILAAGFAVIPLCALLRRMWNERVAFWTGLLYALHPTLSYEQSQVLNTGLYLGLFVSSVALILMALRGDNWLLYPLAGISMALCYLTRPEGIILVGIAGVGAAITAVQRHREGSAPWPRFAGGIALAAVAYTAFAMPYLVWLHRTQGTWCLTARGAGKKLIQPYQDPTKTASAPLVAAPKPGPDKPPTPVVVPTPPPTVPVPPAPVIPSKAPESHRSEKRSFFTSAQIKLRSALFPPLFPALVLGLIVGRRFGGTWLRLIPFWGTALLSFCPALIFLAAVPGFHLSERYLLAGTIFLLPWVVVGFLAVSDGLSKLLSRSSSFPPLKLLPWIPQVAMAVVFLIRTSGPHRPEEFTFLEAGEWLRKNGPPAPRYVISNSDKIPYYGGYRPYAMALEGPDNASVSDQVRRTIDSYRTTNAAFLILHEGSHRHRPELTEGLERSGFQLLQKFDKGARKEGVTVRIYQLKPPPS